MTNRTVMGVLAVMVLGACGGDGGTSTDGGTIDPRCPTAAGAGVMWSRYLPDQQRCVYACAPQADDAGAYRSVDYCDGRCLPVDVPERCGSCTRSCSGSTPYCDLNTTEACAARPPR